MAQSPSGTVTFLFTDVEGSTRLAQEYPEAWEAMRARHHAILQSAMDAHNGHVFQIIGDAFCVAFHTALDALNAAVRAQRSLQSEAWSPAAIKVRMGINTGTAQAGHGDDRSGGYKGYTAMARAQRLMSVGHGGQILLSNSSFELLRGELPPQVDLRDMGEHRLKGLLNPERLWQVQVPGLPQDFPPLQSLNKIPNNLPAQLTSFVGREQELNEIKQELGEHRIVTLTGSGGIGKSRLALQVAAEVLDQYPDGVWFIELAPLIDPGLIPQAILTVPRVTEQAGKTPLKVLEEHLNNKRLLLILDNCEHLIEASAAVAQALLMSAPRTKILASSREALGVRGELAWHVPSLGLPDPKAVTEIEQLSQYESVRLFIERAALVQPHFKVNEANAPAIAQICSRLDGIPLAIELAAARVKALSVDQIGRRLNDRFRLLTGGGRTVLERHQTLRAAIDWSYNLLSEDERWMLLRLSVFMGGWSLDAAEQVCMRHGDGLDVLDLLSHLVDKSLVIADSSAGEVRYHMLETTRQYALEKAIESREAESAHGSHLLYYLALAEEAGEQLIGPDQAEWLNHLEEEHDNLRAALEWSARAGRTEEALRLAGALGMFWLKHSHLSEGRAWLRTTLQAAPDAPDQAQIKARRMAGFLAFFQQDELEAIRLYSENLDREQALGDQWGMAFSLHMLANVAGDGNIEKARELHGRSIAISRAIQATWVQALAEFSLGYIEHAGGNLALGVELSREGLSHFRAVGDKWGMGMVLTNLGHMMYLEGDSPAAKTILLESLALSRELGDKDAMITILIGLAGVLQNEGKDIVSARLHGVVVGAEKELGTTFTKYPLEQRTFASTADALKKTMGPQAYQREFQTGMAIPLEDALKLVSGQG